SSVDTGTNTVSAAVDHFSLFALMAAPAQLPVRLDMNLQFEPTAPDPALVSDAAGSVNLVEQLFLGLVTEDDETGVILPELATSWDISPDGLVYTFTLRNDAYWTDGNLVTADDVRNGILRSLDPATNAPFAYLLFAIENGGDYHDEIISDPDLVGVEALDPTTLRISLTGPTAHFLHILAMPMARPMPQWAIDAYGEAWTEPGNIVSNGPFSFAETLPDDRLRLEKNPDYYDAGNVQIEEVLVWFAGTSTDALTLYQADQLDTTALDDGLGLDAESAQEFRSDPRACNYYYGFSTSEPPFDNALVRRAFSAAIDRAGLIDDLGLSEAPAVTYTPHGVFGHIDGYAEGVGLPYNAAEAQGWLADAGYPGGAGLPPITLWFNESAGHQAIAEQARASWYNTLGVSVTLQTLPWEEYLPFTETGGAQIWRLGWCADYLEAQNFLANSVYGNINRLGGWSNPAYDSLLDLALAQPDESARLDLYRQAEEILVETDAVLAPIYHYVTDRVTRPYLDRTYPAGSISIAPWQTSKVRAVIGPGGGDLVSYDSTVVVSIPAGAFADTVVLSQAPATGMPPDPGQTVVGPVFNAAAVDGVSGLPASPAMPYTLTAEYDEADLAGADESLLNLYYWDGAQWLPEASSVVDPGSNTITATPNHFSRWAVMAEAGLTSGTVYLQGRSDHSGAEVCAWADAVQIDCDTTDVAGAYELAISGGEHTITAEMARYLDAEKTFSFASGEIRVLGDVTLRGGDANDSDTVNILDLSLMGSHFGMNCGDPSWDARADINDDCTVNIQDLSIAGGNYQAGSPVPWYTWDFATIPEVTENGVPRMMAAIAPDNLYVWVEVSNADPLIRTAILYHWDGASWSQELAYPGYNYGRIHANAEDDIFISVSCPDTSGSCSGYETPHLAHFDGVSWQEQTPPAETAAYVRDIGGAPGEVQATTTGSSNDIIIRYDEASETWSHLYTTPRNTKALAFISSGEAYYTACWGHGRWNGSTWEWKEEFDFCDISDLWGIRDEAGDLHLYTVGNNNFSNGIRVWKYTENANPALLGSFGSKCGFVFGDPSSCSGTSGIGSASGVWGSAADDVYVVGRLGAGADPDSGRIYHYDGASWTQLTEAGGISGVQDVQGSGSHDIWFSLTDGRLLHYGQ
ncbi:MAG: ABC transporter substrate-binding protein, partial [Chloroflexota bacterium]